MTLQQQMRIFIHELFPVGLKSNSSSSGNQAECCVRQIGAHLVAKATFYRCRKLEAWKV
jgi:hypothetical protein